MKGQKYQRRNNRTKLYMTMICLVVALIVLALGAFAWYTLSTNPEIKGMNFHVSAQQAIQVSTDGENFSNSEDLSNSVNKFAPLAPSSTVDGLNWFVCKYDVDGNVIETTDKANGGKKFQYLRYPKGGNEAKASDDTSGAGNTSGSSSTTGTDGQVYSYYIYTDIYLRTQEEETNVYLSLPNNSSSYFGKQDETEKNHYGSYVMSYKSTEAGDANADGTTNQADGSGTGGNASGNQESVTLMEGGSETSARVGFLVLGEADDKGDYKNPEQTETWINPNDTQEDTPFFIYEPNADRRSELDKSADEYNSDIYVAGFAAKTFYDNATQGNISYQQANGYYFPTYPVKVDNTTIMNTLSAKINELSNKTANEYNAWARSINMDGDGDGNISVFPASRLLVQKSSTWKTSDSTNASSSDGTTGGDTASTGGTATVTGKNFDSTMLGSMGSFVNTDWLYNKLNLPTSLTVGDDKNSNYTGHITNISDNTTATDLRSSVSLTTLKKDKPQKIRLYFWLEGQDVDCWNDIADTDFLVNLEFVGDVVKQ